MSDPNLVRAFHQGELVAQAGHLKQMLNVLDETGVTEDLAIWRDLSAVRLSNDTGRGRGISQPTTSTGEQS